MLKSWVKPKPDFDERKDGGPNGNGCYHFPETGKDNLRNEQDRIKERERLFADRKSRLYGVKLAVKTCVFLSGMRRKRFLSAAAYAMGIIARIGGSASPEYPGRRPGTG